MSDLALPLSSFVKLGMGVSRPEDVVVERSGRVWASDRRSACAVIDETGVVERVGLAGGNPNGINIDREGRIVIANFGLGAAPTGPLQRLDPLTKEIELLADRVEGRPLVASNYPIIDGAGNIWCSHSTSDVARAMAGYPDGFIFRVGADGRSTIVADALYFPNGLALDAEERYLYVCQTLACDVVRFPIRPDGSLGDRERYGPRLGQCRLGAGDTRLPRRLPRGAPDGCGFDVEGNLWVTLPAANAITVVTQDGEARFVVEDASGELIDGPSNVAWGGDDLELLYIGQLRKSYVLRVKSPVAGLPLVHQRIRET